VGLFEQAHWSALIGAGLATFVTDPGPLCEELGWRGFALPRLEQRWNGIFAALVLGAIWGVWHLPAFFIPGLPQSSFPLWTFMVSSMALSVLMAWVVNNAGGASSSRF
jgi:membrane protease YdiL (CAAX protease family)